ncbi:MAG: hypothetical protein AAGG75_02555 [Bacteroidota bacterium]
MKLLLSSIDKGIALLLLLLLSGCTAPSFAQPAEGPPAIKDLPLKAKFLTTDKLQQAYIVDDNNDVIKLSPQGQELFRYSNKTLGPLGYVDATDPFNVLLYYPEQLTVLTLDRTMNLTGEYRLWDLGLVGSGAVGLSNDNQIWLYDTNDFKLKKVDRKGNTLLESDDLSMTLNQFINPTFILERNNWVYLNEPELGVLVFDNFGNYARTIGIKTNYFQLYEGQLLYPEKGQLMAFHLQSLLTSQIQKQLQLEEGDQVRVEKGVTYVARGKGGIEIYKTVPQ